MRTNHKNMIEILGVFEKDGSYFAHIAKYCVGMRNVYRFGITKYGYNTVKRIHQHKPFETLSQSKYKYFWSGGCGTQNYFYLDIQLEQEKNIKTCSIKSDKQFGANLRWFIEIENPSEIEHLKIEI